jgi:hypothetical protein
MKIKIIVRFLSDSNTCDNVLDIPADDLEGLTGEERDKLLEDLAKEMVWKNVEWGWKPLPWE